MEFQRLALAHGVVERELRSADHLLALPAIAPPPNTALTVKARRWRTIQGPE
jgi:hypothetical protein